MISFEYSKQQFDNGSVETRSVIDTGKGLRIEKLELVM